MKGWRLLGILLVAFITIGVTMSPTLPVSASITTRTDIDPDAGIMNLDHLIFIVQENRSFDSYFGTFPGAEGLPHAHGHFSACIPDPAAHHCQRPYHDTNVFDRGGPHNVAASNITVARRQDGRSSIRALRAIGTTCEHHPQIRLRPREARARRATGCDGLPHRTGDPQLLGVRPPVRTAGSDVRADRTRGHCPRTSTWCRAGRPLAHGPMDPMSCRSDLISREQRGEQRSYVDTSRWVAPAVRVGGYHVAAVSRRRQLGVLRGPRNLRAPPLRAPREAQHQPDPESAPWVPDRQSDERVLEHRASMPVSSNSPRTGTCHRCRGSCRRTVTASTPPTPSRTGKRGSRRS